MPVFIKKNWELNTEDRTIVVSNELGGSVLLTITSFEDKSTNNVNKVVLEWDEAKALAKMLTSIMEN
jgi:hypothetical protein